MLLKTLYFGILKERIRNLQVSYPKTYILAIMFVYPLFLINIDCPNNQIVFMNSPNRCFQHHESRARPVLPIPSIDFKGTLRQILTYTPLTQEQDMHVECPEHHSTPSQPTHPYCGSKIKIDLDNFKKEQQESVSQKYFGNQNPKYRESAPQQQNKNSEEMKLNSEATCIQMVQTPSHFLFFYGGLGQVSAVSLQKKSKRWSKIFKLVQWKEQEGKITPTMVTLAHQAGTLLCGTSAGHIISCQISDLFNLRNKDQRTTMLKEKISLSAVTEIKTWRSTSQQQHFFSAALTAHQQIFIIGIKRQGHNLELISRLCSLNASLLVKTFEDTNKLMKQTKNLQIEVKTDHVSIVQSSSSGVLKVWKVSNYQCSSEKINSLSDNFNLFDLPMRHSIIPNLLISSLFPSSSVLEIRKYGALFLFINSDGFMNFLSLQLGRQGSFDTAESYQNLLRVKIFNPRGNWNDCEQQYVGINTKENIIYVMINRFDYCPESRQVQYSQSFIRKFVLDRSLNISSIQKIMIPTKNKKDKPIGFKIIRQQNRSSSKRVSTQNLSQLSCKFLVWKSQSISYHESTWINDGYQARDGKIDQEIDD